MRGYYTFFVKFRNKTIKLDISTEELLTKEQKTYFSLKYQMIMSFNKKILKLKKIRPLEWELVYLKNRIKCTSLDEHIFSITDARANEFYCYISQIGKLFHTLQVECQLDGKVGLLQWQREQKPELHKLKNGRDSSLLTSHSNRILLRYLFLITKGFKLTYWHLNNISLVRGWCLG